MRDVRTAHRRSSWRQRHGERGRRPYALLRSRDGRRAHLLNTRSFWAPGRVNLIGEFTDLTGGLVLPVALDLGIRVDCFPSERTLLTSDAFQGTSDDGDWGRYAVAVEAELSDLGRAPVGIEGAVHSTLPIGAGLSSSAALEVAVAVALCAVADFELHPLELARATQRAEHRAVGVPTGIMDQAASVLGRAGHAI
ncbi:MAG TPA: galactokinase family protein, partial [Gaiellaceae bacterium]|nr:galactokinase family protein [Gaiellaceae bacterium]